MDYILDASCLINLVNGNVLHRVADIPMTSFAVGPVVMRECITIRKIIESIVESRRILLLDDSDMRADLFISILERYNLGPGETECIVSAKKFEFAICTDDKKARAVAGLEIGRERVSGSLGLLKAAVGAEVFSAENAYQSYVKMVGRGAFLPSVKLSYFIR